MWNYLLVLMMVFPSVALADHIDETITRKPRVVVHHLLCSFRSMPPACTPQAPGGPCLLLHILIRMLMEKSV
jgi:hypothetical protein